MRGGGGGRPATGLPALFPPLSAPPRLRAPLPCARLLPAQAVVPGAGRGGRASARRPPERRPRSSPAILRAGKARAAEAAAGGSPRAAPLRPRGRGLGRGAMPGRVAGPVPAPYPLPRRVRSPPAGRWRRFSPPAPPRPGGSRRPVEMGFAGVVEAVEDS